MFEKRKLKEQFFLFKVCLTFNFAKLIIIYYPFLADILSLYWRYYKELDTQANTDS